MRTDIVFNELSLLPIYPSKEGADAAMDTFIATIKACREVGIGALLRIPEGFHTCELAGSYPIARWLNDQQVDKEKKLFVGTLATKAPYFEDMLGSTAANGFDEAEFTHEGHEAMGLGVAYLLDAIAISLSGSESWREARVEINSRVLDEVTCEILDAEVAVRHASVPAHAAMHGAELVEGENASVVSGSSLWDARARLFPSLEFCASVESQIKSLRSGSGGLSVVFRSFKELQTLCDGWLDGSFDSSKIPNTTRESGATLQQFADERTFMKPDGVEEVFSWHMKRGAIRIHFVPEADRKTCVVGYVGVHLRTVRNR